MYNIKGRNRSDTTRSESVEAGSVDALHTETPQSIRIGLDAHRNLVKSLTQLSDSSDQPDKPGAIGSRGAPTTTVMGVATLGVTQRQEWRTKDLVETVL